MPNKEPATAVKALVIVESPAKARTISKYLGKNFTVEASVGHIRDLPKGRKEVPEALKKEDWAYLGVNVNDRFTPIYIVPDDKKQQVSKLKKALKGCSELYLATDEDREGEAISWHLLEVLKPKVPVYRLVFHEITKEAITEALANPREVDDALVRAQEARRILDRLYGYDVSQLLWKKVGRGLSAGRVQSVSVRLIVERERARMAFNSATYWDATGLFATEQSEEFSATLASVDGQRIPTGKDFDSTTGKLKDNSLLLLDEEAARALVERLRSAEFRVTSVEQKPFKQQPAPPFTTSTMQQEANRKLGFTARRTMRAAQSLYENGHITYMRTDSTNLAGVAVDAARDLVRSEYGNEYLPDQPRVYKSKVKNAQEAHEAIRPAGHPFELPDVIGKSLAPDERKLFEMIWKRTIASQMADARGFRTTITVEGGGAAFRVSGKTIEFPGFLRAYVEGSDNPESELADKETLLPAVSEGQQVDCRELTPHDHTTQPPARYTEASLTRKLEEMGIGRPSTYASIIETIQNREYVFKKGSALVPTWVAFAVTRLLEQHLESLVDYQFTAQMEDFLDAISRREAEHAEYLREFYFGNGTPGLKARVEAKESEIDPRLMSRFPLGKPESGEHREEVVLRVGKYGPFLEQGERKASLPDGMAPDEITLEKSLELLDAGMTDDEPLGICPETEKPVYLKVGRFGPYVQLGSPDDDEKPKNASLLPGMSTEDVTFELALKLLSLPREVGTHPEHNEPVVAHNGRYGPYIKCGKETRSLPAGTSPLNIALDEALKLLAQPKQRGRAAAKPPLKVFEASPVTGEPIALREGRYGPYFTDGQTNASLPRNMDPEEATFDLAVRLLEERAAKGAGERKKPKRKNPPRRRRPKRNVARKRPPRRRPKRRQPRKRPRNQNRERQPPVAPRAPPRGNQRGGTPGKDASTRSSQRGLQMKASMIRVLTFLIAAYALGSSAWALPPWKPKFKERFVDDGPQSLQDAFADKVIGSCKVCHVNGQEKTVRNPFGVALDKQIEGNAGERLKAAAEKGDDAKAAEQAALDGEFLAALEVVLKLPSPSGGGTYGQRIKAGQLPFVPAVGAPNTLTAEEQAAGWQLLFDGKTTAGWNSWRTKQPLESDKWVVADGALTLEKGGGDIYSAEAFENFELVLEWKTTGNSGILIRVDPEAGGAIYSVAPEMQINRGMGASKTSTAALYDIYAVEGEPVYHADDWNEVRIRLVDGQGTHWFNGHEVYSYTIGSEDWNERIASSKWRNKTGFAETATGHIGLQDHGAKVAFRNIKIRVLDSAE